MAAHISGAGLKRQVIFWLIAFTCFVLFLLVFSDILLPFIAGMALAYFLDPVADRLERVGLSRMMATVVILVAFVIDHEIKNGALGQGGGCIENQPSVLNTSTDRRHCVSLARLPQAVVIAGATASFLSPA